MNLNMEEKVLLELLNVEEGQDVPESALRILRDTLEFSDSAVEQAMAAALLRKLSQ